MKTIISLLILLFTLYLVAEAPAYRNDVVNISETNYDNMPKKIYKYYTPQQIREKKPAEPPPPPPDNKKDQNKKDESPEATRLMGEAAMAVKSALLKEFPCLKVFTASEIKNELAELKKMQFIGPTGTKWIEDARKDNTNPLETFTSAEEEEAFQKSLQDKMDVFNIVGEAKYNISVVASAKNIVNVKVNALSKFWEKRSGYFYQENKIYQNVDAARADFKRIADELVDAFVENAANEPVKNNEVCPFKGTVEVKAITRRKQQQEDTYPEYCNGQDHQGRKTQSATTDAEYLWQFNRFGNPDTNGTMKGSVAGKFIYEEESGCYPCTSGKTGFESIRSETELTGALEGLDASTRSMKTGKSDNKDATIRLHFLKNGTYKVSVRAVSKEGTKKFTKTITANGVCDIPNEKPKTENQSFTMPLEQQFGPFTGTVRDRRLKDKQVLVVSSDDLKDEVTEFTLEFDLERPEKK